MHHWLTGKDGRPWADLLSGLEIRDGQLTCAENRCTLKGTDACR